MEPEFNQINHCCFFYKICTKFQSLKIIISVWTRILSNKLLFFFVHNFTKRQSLKIIVSMQTRILESFFFYFYKIHTVNYCEPVIFFVCGWLVPPGHWVRERLNTYSEIICYKITTPIWSHDYCTDHMIIVLTFRCYCLFHLL